MKNPRKVIRICRNHHQIMYGQEWMSFDHNLRFESKMKNRLKREVKFIEAECPMCLQEKSNPAK